jgi:hypothetical protein
MSARHVRGRVPASLQIRGGNQSLAGRRRADGHQTLRGRTHRHLCQTVTHCRDVFALRNERSSSRTQKFVTLALERERRVKGASIKWQGPGEAGKDAVYGAATLRQRSERATDAPPPHDAPGPKDGSTPPGPPPTREAERLTPGAQTRPGGGTFSPIRAGLITRKSCDRCLFAPRRHTDTQRRMAR